MPRTSYQYGTSPRKYEPEYTNRKEKKQIKTKQKNEKIEEVKRKF